MYSLWVILMRSWGQERCFASKAYPYGGTLWYMHGWKFSKMKIRKLNLKARSAWTEGAKRPNMLGGSGGIFFFSKEAKWCYFVPSELRICNKIWHRYHGPAKKMAERSYRVVVLDRISSIVRIGTTRNKGTQFLFFFCFLFLILKIRILLIWLFSFGGFPPWGGRLSPMHHVCSVNVNNILCPLCLIVSPSHRSRM